VYQENYKDAETPISWVMNHASTDSLRQVARLRLARVYIQENNPKEALTILKKTNDKGYLPMIDEVEGDSYLALNETDNARVLIRRRLIYCLIIAVARPILVMKLNDLATGTKQ